MIRRETLVALCSALLALAVLTLPLGVMFGPTLARGDVAAMRDGAHFYLPLWSWIGAEQREGRWPSWNPLENLGQSLVADPTAATFYPGRVILALPFAPATNFNLFLIAHLILAACGGYHAARSLTTPPNSRAAPRVGALATDSSSVASIGSLGPSSRVSRSAALIAGLSYACGAPVLFQYSNPIYLIGAAWLPWSLAFGVRWLRGGGARSCATSAAALALMFLGGDPQSAYHALLALAVAPFFGMRTGVDRIRSLAFGASVVGRLTPLVLITVGLAAVQILPASRAAEESVRSPGRNARSIWELAGRSRTAKDLVKAAEPGSHDEQIYDFSVGPWRWPELIWPNISGRMFPTHHRWISAVPAEGRVWTPSLYSGLWPILLALATLQLRRQTRLERQTPDADSKADEQLSTRQLRTTTAARWLTALAVLSLLAACGTYGVVWLTRELQWQLLRKPPAADGWNGAVGGLYWWCATVLPGYAYFRYPAKWLTIFTMAVALLAALGWDRLSDTSFRLRVRRICRSTAAISAIGLALLAMAWSSGIWADWLRGSRDAWFGPLDAAGAARDAAWALAQTMTLAIGLELLLIANSGEPVAAEPPPSATSSHRSRLSRSASGGDRVGDGVGVAGVGAMGALAIGVVVLDLVLANHWLVREIPAAPFAQFTSSVPAESSARGAARGPVRIYRHESSGTLPEAWSERSAATRLVDTSRLERAAWQLRWNQLAGRAVVSAEETLGTCEWQAVLEAAASTATQDELRPDIARLFGIGAFASPTESVAKRLEGSHATGTHAPVETDRRATTEVEPPAGAARRDETAPKLDATIAPSRPSLPRAWLVSRVTVLEALSPGAESNDAELLERTRLVFGDRADSRDWAREAVVELPMEASQELRDRLATLTPPPGHRDASTNSGVDGGEKSNAMSDAVEIVSSEPKQIVLDVRCSTPALLVVADRFTDDWKAQSGQLETTAPARDSPVLRTDRVLRGVLVPAGRVRVTIRYEPRRARLGGAVSLATLIVAMAMALRGRPRSRERTLSSEES